MGEFLRDRLPDPVAYYQSEGLKLDGKGKWRTTKCEFHGGRDSMRINVTSGAFVCMAGCGARGGDVLAYHMAEHGLDFITAAKALGAWDDNGKSEKPRRPKPLSATDAIHVLALETRLVAIAAANLANGVKLTNQDRERLNTAAQRIQHLSAVFA